MSPRSLAHASAQNLRLASRTVKVQLWSCNYDPEPTGIAPLSRAWVYEMRRRGHEVDVVAAQPHYPDPVWPMRRRPYRELRDGVSVIRLPLWSGRQTTTQRVRQEFTYALSLGMSLPFLGQPELIVAVSPSFPALAPAMVNARVRRIPWVLWLQDILPDGASATGLLDRGSLLTLSRRFERAAYRSASNIVVLSAAFEENLRAKGVPAHKIAQIYNPASRPLKNESRRTATPSNVVLTMGNVGYSQNLEAIVAAFEESSALAELNAKLIIAGDGVAGDVVRSAIRTDRVSVTGILDDGALDQALSIATVALVSQHYTGPEFNVPSKLMNFMGQGLPVVASVRQDSEVARILSMSGGGWVTDSARPGEGMEAIARALQDRSECDRRGRRALAFARENFAPAKCVRRFESVLTATLDAA